MRLLIDMNLAPRWVEYLIEAGHDAIHWCVAGPVNAKDREVCDYRHDYVLLTNDLDFPQILAYTRDAAPSVILLRGEPLVPRSFGSALLHAIELCQQEIIRGAIVTLDWSGKPRARVLPLT
jgi:predicted nuclease of predicted toxin-antitoxin system